MKLRRLLRHIALVTLFLISGVELIAAPSKGWEQVRGEMATNGRTVVRDRENEIEVRVQPGAIVVSTSHNSQIKVFTILGRLVNNDTLQPGTYRLTLPANGVYILKVGDMTCKVAV